MEETQRLPQKTLAGWPEGKVEIEMSRVKRPTPYSLGQTWMENAIVHRNAVQACTTVGIITTMNKKYHVLLTQEEITAIKI